MIIRKKATEEEFIKMAEDFGGHYIKVVVDLDRKILAGGGERYVDAEQILLEDGSSQDVLWGGGIDTKTKLIDYNSMINIRPTQDNRSRDILSLYIQKEFEKIVEDLLV